MEQTEIERKYLLDGMPEGWESLESEAIAQGYIGFTDEGVEIRVRQRGAKYYQTLKSGSARERRELELDITQEQFEALWAWTGGKRLRKTRFYMPFGESTIEIDRYEEGLDGLVVAEVEFPSLQAADAFVPPAWFGREITEEANFRNRELAMRGYKLE